MINNIKDSFFTFTKEVTEEGKKPFKSYCGVKWEEIERFHITSDGMLYLTLKNMTEEYKDLLTKQKRKAKGITQEFYDIVNVKVPSNISIVIDKEEDILKFLSTVLISEEYLEYRAYIDAIKAEVGSTETNHEENATPNEEV